ncbi:DUF6504 family protein [Chloroflexota bacterium]
MTKLIGEPIKVHSKDDSNITAFVWRKRHYRVNEVVNWWREPSDWWNGTAMRFFVRVNATNSSTGTYDIYKLGEVWFLHRVFD